jgi:putative ABC transport system permease protein
MSWWSRFANVVRGERVNQDLDDEQRFHIESRADDLEREGLSRQEALEQASRQFGHRLVLREASRDVKILTRIESVSRDLVFGARLLRKDAVVSLAAIFSLGLAIGACAAAFSLIDALILRQLPVPEPHRLVYLARPGAKDPISSSIFSYPFFDRVRQTAAPQMEAFSLSEQSLRQAVLQDTGGVEEKLVTQFVSGNAFDALGVTPAIGRLLGPSDDVVASEHPVAVISHAFWKRRLGADPAVLGQWIQLEQKLYQIVGVARAGFTGTQPGVLTDIWIPNMTSRFAESVTNPHWGWLQVWGRLSPGVGREAIQPIVRTLANIAEEDGGKAPGKKAAESALAVVEASTGLSHVRHDFQRPLLALAAIVGLVLLIACSNVANLLLARGAARRREMALRASIGAGRGRLLQQALVESSVLTLAGAGLGVLGAFAAVPLIVGMLSTNEHPVYLEARLDWRVLLFVATLGCITTVLFGLAPALRASASMPGETITHGDRRHTTSPGLARSLVAVQIGFSLMILFVAGLLLRSFDRLLSVDLGFTPARVTLLSVEARERFEPPQARAVVAQLFERVQAMPGVESASASSWALFRGWSWGSNVDVPGSGSAQSSRLAISPGFFRTMGIRILDGREFVPRDAGALDPVPVIVNETFARKYLPGERAVGRRLTTTSRGQLVSYEIVGVTADAKDGSVRGEMSPFLFSIIEDPAGTLEIRSSLDARTLADYLRKELPLVHPSLRLVDVTRQASLVGNTLLRERLLAVLSGFFAAVGLILAAVGLYGVLSYAVVRRTREIGIRLALGAQALSVVRSIGGRVALAIAVGVVTGLAGGLYFARFVESFLYETQPLSLASVGLPLMCLLIVAVVATWSPMRRAIRVDPAEALRTD